MVNEKEEEYKKIRIYAMILLFKKEIPPKFGLSYGFPSFWNMSANAFYFVFDMMNPILLNVATIVGLLVDEDEVSYLHNILGNDLGFQVNKKNNAYSIFINTFNRGSGLIGDLVHKVFFLF